eukprot:SAG31_NODE_13310_length_878_cov_0.996149_2_plen_53_part_00
MMHQNINVVVPVLFEVFDVLDKMRQEAGGGPDWVPEQVRDQSSVHGMRLGQQ